MVRKFESKEISVNHLVSVVCDVCGSEYSYEEDVLEAQEFLHINLMGGYKSVFGDMTHVECDVCQDCLKKLLGKYLRCKDAV